MSGFTGVVRNGHGTGQILGAGLTGEHLGNRLKCGLRDRNRAVNARFDAFNRSLGEPNQIRLNADIDTDHRTLFFYPLSIVNHTKLGIDGDLAHIPFFTFESKSDGLIFLTANVVDEFGD